ncbi:MULTISPECIES: hypothetical protein [unclassified Diaminobutyricimonas]|uniref:SCO4848 family membrane protein n=1 Tax=unclassified Diaminobutyricimonas TaxID=2643261 RepID=UPI0012F52892|nr:MULTISPECIES: hypothetical protein [unclassified Diaminobutyricimonas]
MLVVLAIALLVNAVFNVVVWPRFLKRIAADPRARDANGKRTAFYRVHAVLIGMALVIAVGSAVLGIWALVA